jgi:hypothetical protein
MNRKLLLQLGVICTAVLSALLSLFIYATVGEWWFCMSATVPDIKCPKYLWSFFISPFFLFLLGFLGLLIVMMYREGKPVLYRFFGLWVLFFVVLLALLWLQSRVYL